jgi:hypothetical protein
MVADDLATDDLAWNDRAFERGSIHHNVAET